MNPIESRGETFSARRTEKCSRTLKIPKHVFDAQERQHLSQQLFKLQFFEEYASVATGIDDHSLHHNISTTESDGVVDVKGQLAIPTCQLYKQRPT
jgi:hypothetical protein